jgi:hypothetical protein
MSGGVSAVQQPVCRWRIFVKRKRKFAKNMKKNVLKHNKYASPEKQIPIVLLVRRLNLCSHAQHVLLNGRVVI